MDSIYFNLARKNFGKDLLELNVISGDYADIGPLVYLEVAFMEFNGTDEQPSFNVTSSEYYAIDDRITAKRAFLERARLAPTIPTKMGQSLEDIKRAYEMY